MVAPLEIPVLEITLDADLKAVKTERKQGVEANFEDAMKLAGVGKFQLRAILCSVLCLYTIMSESMCIAFALPAAQCDLDLSMSQKGLLSSTVFIGFICSAHLWGAIGDIRGRRSTMLRVLFATTWTTLGASLAPSYLPMLLFRFLSGFLSCGTAGLLYVFVGEFYDNANRPKAVLAVAAIGATSSVGIPSLALAIIPRSWSIPMPFGLPDMVSWRIFIALNAVPYVVAFLMLKYALPESPKFLLESGRAKEALDIMRQIFETNKGRPQEEYPIQVLHSEEEKDEGKKSIFGLIWSQTAPLFGRELRKGTVLVSFMMFAGFFGFQAPVIWQPEIFNRLSNNEDISASLCAVMEGNEVMNSTLELLSEGMAVAGETSNIFPVEWLKYNVTGSEEPLECVTDVDESAYINSMILNAAAGICNIVAGLSVGFLGKRALLVSLFVSAGCVTAILPFITEPTLLLVLYCTGVALACGTPGVVTAVTIDLFPTKLRGMATSLAMMTARVGIVISTMAFGIMLDVQCELAFFMLTAVLVAGGLIALMVPR